MRLTNHGNRLALVAAAAAWVASAGCQRLPYIDQAKAVPHEPLESIAKEDKDVKTASLLTNRAPAAMPRVDPPRTTNNPEAQEVWPMSLQQAITIGLDNSEVIRVISLGAQGIPVGGFEPTPLNTGPSGALGQGTLTTVYDPAIQETNIAQALSAFDTQFTTSMLWGRNESPFNNAIQAGTFNPGAAKFPVIFTQETQSFATSLSKRTATGAQLTVGHNVNFSYSNSPANVFPSAYTTNTQLRFTQPLLGGTAQNPSGLEANRAPIIIARLTADSAVWQLKAEVMAHVRSIEQQYWALAQQHVQLWSREVAVELGEEILRREQAKFDVGTGSIPNVAEAKEQLERFRLELVTATADVITTERQLRNILGLKPADNRRIVPVTAPTEARLEPDWDVSLAQMVSFQPDIVRNQLLVRLAELQLLVSRNQLLPQLNLDALYQFNGFGHTLDRAEAVGTGANITAINPLTQALQRSAGVNPTPGLFHNFQSYQVGLTFIMPLGFRNALSNVRQAQYQLLRQRAFLQQVVHQTTHSLARFFLEVDANYKQFKTAGRLREAAQQRLEAQQAFYEAGSITIDRYLDALRNWATAVALEAQYKTSYNTSIIALEEAKGTLLAYDNIALAEGPHPPKAYVQARDQQAGHRRFPLGADGPYHPAPISGPPNTDPVTPMPSPNLGPPNPLPPLPAPVGPAGPPPTPAAPMLPAGAPNILSRGAAPKSDAPAVLPASAPGETTRVDPSTLPPLPVSEPGAGSSESLPPLPGS